MQDRTSLVLQGVAAFCVWALLALNFGGWIFEVRDKVILQGISSVPGSTLLGAVLLVVLGIAILGFSIHRFIQVIRAPAHRDA